MTTFKARARALYALAAQLLHWNPDTFWDATPSEFACALGIGADDGVLDGHSVSQLRELITEKEACHGRGT